MGGEPAADTVVSQNYAHKSDFQADNNVPVEKLLEPPSFIARYSCASVLLGAFAVWGKLTFVPEEEAPGVGAQIHDFRVPLVLTVGYLVSLPILRIFAASFLSKNVDVKLLLRESMILYNAAQVILNGWMVYRFVDAILFRGHPFVGDVNTVSTGATYAVWVHYCDKYLEFFDTYFMVLRGKMDQVRFRDCGRCDQDRSYTPSYPFAIRCRSSMCIITSRLHGPGGTQCRSFRVVTAILVLS